MSRRPVKTKTVKRGYNRAPETSDFAPAEYVVWQHMPSGTMGRVGGARSMADAEALIHKSEASLRDTLGGLIPASPPGVYSIWKATKWERVG